MTRLPFADPTLVGRYATDTPRRVPGLADLHRMALILLTEKADARADILVLGAGGGLELRAFAEARPDWSLTGVDPSQPMLDLAAQVLGPFREGVELVRGTIDDMPERRFDGATCLLTLHVLPMEERLQSLRGLKRRLKPGAPLILAQHGDPGVGPVETWLARSARFGAGPDAEPAGAMASASEMARRLTLLSAQEEAAQLKQAGFVNAALFYAALSFRGWVAWAKEG